MVAAMAARFVVTLTVSEGLAGRRPLASLGDRQAQRTRRTTNGEDPSWPDPA
jgi:hypothetical protein